MNHLCNKHLGKLHDDLRTLIIKYQVRNAEYFEMSSVTSISKSPVDVIVLGNKLFPSFSFLHMNTNLLAIPVLTC